MLDSAKEDAEKVRDDLQRLNGSLTSPTLEELCKSFHTISMVRALSPGLSNSMC